GARRSKSVVPTRSALALQEAPELPAERRPQPQVARKEPPERGALQLLEIVHRHLIPPQLVLEHHHASERSSELRFTCREAVALGQKVFVELLDALPELDQSGPIEYLLELPVARERGMAQLVDLFREAEGGAVVAAASVAER